ncbi:MAG TPA: L-threonylcarbamoyladenylate synthase [Candidatus Binatia bacterium]
MKEKSNDASLEEAVEALRSGEVIVFPTETLYGLAANALDPNAVNCVASLKGRNPNRPMPLIIADVKGLSEVARDIPPMAETLMRRFWPGPLTLVLPAKKGLPAPLLNSDGRVGVRVSSHPVAAALARGLGSPITATSANPSGKAPARTVEEARRYFSARVRIFIDGGELQGRQGSTVVAFPRDGLEIIREGAVSAAAIAEALAEGR